MLSKDYLNVRGHVIANRLPGGANRRCDCYRPDTLGDGITSNVGTHKLVAGVMHDETPSTQTFISDGQVSRH